MDCWLNNTFISFLITYIRSVTLFPVYMHMGFFTTVEKRSTADHLCSTDAGYGKLQIMSFMYYEQVPVAEKHQQFTAWQGVYSRFIETIWEQWEWTKTV